MMRRSRLATFTYLKIEETIREYFLYRSKIQLLINSYKHYIDISASQ